jgi:TFIIH basal transcription factor complex TTD-A subunit
MQPPDDMVKAVKGTFHNLSNSVRRQVTISKGALIKCDASIKAMLVDIDKNNNHEFIIEDLDEEHILVKETKVNTLKARLQVVSARLCFITSEG